MRVLILALLLCCSCYQNNSPPIAFPKENVDHADIKEGKLTTIEGKLYFKKYEWSKTQEGWDNIGVNFFLADKEQHILPLVASDEVAEEQLHRFEGKNVSIKAQTLANHGTATPGTVYPVKNDGTPDLERPLRYLVLEISLIDT